LERTGISRATLNNYISWGIVPRPDVLPPEPLDGAAPRIGYFPVEIVKRIEEIQRLKRDGWSMTKISEHFGGGQAAAIATPDAAKAPRPPAERLEPFRSSMMPRLYIEEIAQPAYLVNDRFEVTWLNDAACSGAWPSLVELPLEAVSQGIFRYLLQIGPQDTSTRQAVLRFHMGLAKQRGTGLSDLCRGVPREEIATMERLYNEAESIRSNPLAQTSISPVRPGGPEPLTLHAVNFREGILFLYVPGGPVSKDVSILLAHPDAVAGEGERKRIPELTHVAVLFTDLERSNRLWSELPADEYFELINHIWLTVDPIFRRCRGTHGKHPGEGMVCYFFPQPDSSYLWNALVAAHQMREAIHRVSKEWQLRKRWTTELYMNTGIAEGQDWVGAFRSGAQVEFTVLGDTVNHAAQMSSFSRFGAIWATRSLLGKLRADERQRLKYGVRRKSSDGRDVLVSSIFSRVENLIDISAAGNEHLASIARLSVTEILDIAAGASAADRTAGRNPG
jgi:class 3 adenylate cyclase